MREKIEVCKKTKEILQWCLFGLQIPLKKKKLNELLKHGVILRIGTINFFQSFQVVWFVAKIKYFINYDICIICVSI